jgi:O-antigen/teichoic acid export membrane protein
MRTEGALAVADRDLSLRERVLRAGSWSFAGYAIAQIIRFGTNLLMTRLLVPEMFGVMSVALMVMLGLALFSDVGLRQSVVQHRRGTEPAFLDTVWLTKMGFGAAVCVAAALIGAALGAAAESGLFPPGSAYAAPELPWVLAVLGAGAVVSGAESTRSMEASRHLALAKVTQMSIIAQVVSVLAMIALAAVHRSIWVLVFGSLVSSAVTTLLSHTWLPGSPNRLRWDPQAFREIIGYGKWVLLSSVLGFFANSGDKMLLGGLVSAATLGVYSIAFMLMAAIENAGSKIIADVTFPALSEVARDPRRDLRAALYRFYVPCAALCVGAAAAMVVAGPALVRVLYDDRYAGAGWMLQVLSLALLAVPSRVHAMCLLSVGDARAHSNVVMARLVTVLVGVPIGFHLAGLTGAVWSVVASYLSVIPVSLIYSARRHLIEARVEIVVAVAIAVVLALAVLLGSTPRLA